MKGTLQQMKPTSVELHFQLQNISFVDNARFFGEFEKLIHLTFNDNKYLFPEKRKPILETAALQFDCENCDFDEIHELTFALMPKLLTLNLNLNEIHKVHKSTFRKTRDIRNIVLSKNHFLRVPEIIHQLGKLKLLDLSYNVHLNFLKNVPILRQNNLRVLNLENCNITQLFKESFSRLPNIENLNLNNNRIEVIAENAFLLNKNLFKLNLWNNPLKRFSCTTLTIISSIVNEAIFEKCFSNSTTEKIRKPTLAIISSIITVNSDNVSTPSSTLPIVFETTHFPSLNSNTISQIRPSASTIPNTVAILSHSYLSKLTENPSTIPPSVIVSTPSIFPSSTSSVKSTVSPFLTLIAVTLSSFKNSTHGENSPPGSSLVLAPNNTISQPSSMVLATVTTSTSNITKSPTKAMHTKSPFLVATENSQLVSI